LTIRLLGAGQVVSSLLEAKKTVLYLTNAAPKCRTEVSKKLEKLGIPSTPTMCVPSCFLAARALADISERTPAAFDKKQHVAFVIGTGTGILVELNKVGISTLHADDVFKGLKSIVLKKLNCIDEFCRASRDD
jgi:ribonucleotide monophosphatase NagD (HAD superfamily)